MLEPDVREYFPNSEAVNKALRCLIPLMTKKPKLKNVLTCNQKMITLRHV